MPLVKKIAIALLSFITSSACQVTEIDQKNVRNPFEGKNYDRQTGFVLPVASIGDKKVDLTTIEGELLLDLKPIPIPLKNQKLNLIKGDKLVSSVSSDSDGRFKFFGEFRNGKYEIQIESKKYNTHYPLEVKSSQIKNIKFLVREM